MHSFAAHLSERRPNHVFRIAVRPPVLVGMSAALILLAAAGALWLDRTAALDAAAISLR
jgi:hypothetical protein